MTQSDRILIELGIDQSGAWNKDDHPDVLFYYCPHDVEIALRADGDVLFTSCEICKERAQEIPERVEKQANCMSVCAEKGIMPKMQQYIKDGLSEFQSVKKTSEYFNNNFNIDVSKDRIQNIYRERAGLKNRNLSLDKPQSNNSKGLPDPCECGSVDKDDSLDWAMGVFQIAPELTVLGFKILRHGLDKHFSILNIPEKQKEVEKAAKILEEAGYGEEY